MATLNKNREQALQLANAKLNCINADITFLNKLCIDDTIAVVFDRGTSDDDYLTKCNAIMQVSDDDILNTVKRGVASHMAHMHEELMLILQENKDIVLSENDTTLLEYVNLFYHENISAEQEFKKKRDTEEV